MNHSKVLVTFIVCAGLVSSLFIFTRQRSSEVSPLTTSLNTAQNTEKKPDVDSDTDGLKDWEEVLVGTDPQNPDTDSDGTSDGDEVAQGRDPKRAGPNDKVTVENLIAPQTVTVEDRTLTEQVAQDFFGKYILAKQQNIPVDKNTALQIADSVVQNTPTTVNYTLYKPADIKTSSDIRVRAKEEYASKLSSIINKNSPKNTSNELTIIATALESQQEYDLLKLDLIIAGYKGIIQDTLKITVPKDALFDHIVYLNALSRIYTDISEMRDILNDPVKGYAAFSRYKENALILKVAFDNMEAYFAQ